MAKLPAYSTPQQHGTISTADSSGAWANQWPGSHYYGGQNLNVVWQDTTSNATYCSAASALSAS